MENQSVVISRTKGVNGIELLLFVFIILLMNNKNLALN